ncbi:hypothetical protein DCC85_02095 [Paenibacillus sp. CAA11]|uniref:DUF5050 domain-containing protein n=1 Tax=Paenibacillus sp. CAA11 TaxID=1532905 RepID=UPI000D3A3A06|nr:DUF5050 domain-containing protein [Paenibacillus sp. CAA11]AWB43141.1 hypothetical protein DCC85_02095 [Paenibacillus sp. CAA11]
MADEINLASGGMVLRTEDQLICSDLASYAGSWLLDPLSPEPPRRLEGLLWFMNRDGQTVYCSDQLQGHRLCKLDLGSGRLELLLDRPVYGLIRQDEWLYYIHEEDRRLYRCQVNGRGEMRLTDEAVESFVIREEEIYYAADHMLRTCSLTGKQNERYLDLAAAGLVLSGQQLLFSDRQKQYALSIVDLATGEVTVHEDVIPASMNVRGRYLYCANRSNGNSIYRIDLEQGSKIRIYGEPADYLHLIGEELYFINNKEWYRMSLLGGQAVKAIPSPVRYI